mgnify:CR=1 FL=1
MFMLTSSLERAAFALLAVALSTATLAAATLLPMTSSPAAVFAKAKPTVEPVLVSYEPSVRATRLN